MISVIFESQWDGKQIVDFSLLALKDKQKLQTVFADFGAIEMNKRHNGRGENNIIEKKSGNETVGTTIPFITTTSRHPFTHSPMHFGSEQPNTGTAKVQ